MERRAGEAIPTEDAETRAEHLAGPDGLGSDLEGGARVGAQPNATSAPRLNSFRVRMV